jgi:4-hydroxythreonine-4-phosphate dehydrogenase
MNKPYIGIAMGDPAGVGPEIILKALMHDKIYDVCKPVVIGCKEILEYFIKKYDFQLKIHTIKDVNNGFFKPHTMDLINMSNIDIANMKVGEIQASCGKAAYEYIVKSVQLAIEKKINAIATAPINKEALKAANVPFIGHTEILASLTDSYNPLTMFQVYNLRVFFLTRHLSLKKACEYVTKENVYEFIVRCNEALNCLGMQNSKIAVAGLNPHSGEHGLFGDEEIKEIEPAIMIAQKEGINVIGPVAADSVFLMGLKGKYDAVLSLYHDQGHIATKMVDFERTISITNNLPFLRTSVDHGTAFDIAGQGIASEISMIEAIKLAAQYGKYFDA